MTHDTYHRVATNTKRKPRVTRADLDARRDVNSVLYILYRDCVESRHATPAECRLFTWLFGYEPPAQYPPATWPDDMPEFNAPWVSTERFYELADLYRAGQFGYTPSGFWWKPELTGGTSSASH